MTNLRTSTDILQDALFHAGEPQNSSSEYYTQAVIYLNRNYQSLCSGGSEFDPDIDETWWWLRKATPGVLTLIPSINIITASVTLGSANITFNAAPTNYIGTQVSVQGFMFMVQGDNGDVYRIASHTSGQTTATLDLPYTSTTNAAAAIRLIQFQYPLNSDCKSIVGRMRAYQMNRYFIDYADLDAMRTMFPLSTLPVGAPINFSMVGEQTVEFSHYPGDNLTDVMRVEYDYTVIPPDLVDDGVSQPLLPFQYRPFLSDATAAIVLADKDDSKASAFINGAKQRLIAMAKEHRRRMAQTSNVLGKIMPRQIDLRRFDSPLRTQSGLIIG